MKKKRLYLCILALCLTASFCGCRKKAAETESETQTVTETETQTEKATEKKTEKVTEKTTEKTTEKKTVSAGTKTSSTQKTTVKPSTVKPGTTTGNTRGTTAGTNTNTGTYPTQMCPYCYNQISTAPNGDGTTVYSVHVAQEKAWADTYGYGSTPSTEATQPSTNASSGNSGSTDDSAQCPYCYQWFSVSDGTYNAHVTQEQNYISSNNSTTEYVQCPKCGNVYPSGSAYDNHVCASN